MKAPTLFNRLSLLVIPFLFSGCYTQFQAYDRTSSEQDRYSDYYAWDGFEDGRENPDAVRSYAYDEYSESQARKAYSAGYYDDDYAELEEAGIYYKDYETEKWYKENYANNVYWEGYEDGYGNGYEDGFDGGYERAAQKYASRSYFYGYKPWAYNSWYLNSHRFHRHFIWGAGFGLHFGGYSGLWASNWPYDMYSSSGYWYYDNFGYLRYNYYPYYSSFGYGYAGFYGNPYYNTLVIYNDYNRTNRYRRSAELYRKGPRNSGLVNRDSYRSRSKSDYTPRTRGSSVRSRGINSSTRVRSTGRSGSVGRSSGNVTRSRGTSGSGSSRSRGSGNNINRSRSGDAGSGASVGRSRTNNRSGSGVTRSRTSSDNSSSRSRGAGNLSSSNSRNDIERSSASRISRSIYSVPVKRVETNRRVNTSRSSFLNNRSSFRSAQTRNSYDLKLGNRNVRSNKSTSVFGRTIRKAINNSSSRSSSVSRSSKTRNVTRSTNTRSSSKSTSRSSGSSKRSRGGN